MTISPAARSLCATWFSMGPKSTLRSHAPHHTLSKHRAEIEELKAAGVITEAPFNDLGSVEFTGSKGTWDIAHEIFADFAKKSGLSGGGEI
jgi:hypothetical protein